MEFLAARPPRCTLVNLATQARMECLLNPESLTEKLSVSYRRLSIPGLGYMPLQYDATANRIVPGLELVLDRRFAGVDPTNPDIMAFREFLRALARPVESDLPSAPPRTLLVWPKVIGMECVLQDVEFRYQSFAVDGGVLVYTATCTLEEVIDVVAASGGVA